jgi:CRISPR-associated protein (TIGR03986 family)
MPDIFHNPYHFVPLADSKQGPERHPVPTASQSLPEHASHARLMPKLFSGRVNCRLTTMTPLVIGAEQDGEYPKRVYPYFVPGTHDPTVPDSGVPGIPGSALRGLISSLMEAATQSAFRVLEDRHFSFRKGMQEGLSSIGMIVDLGRGLELYPLADPHMERMERGHPQSSPSSKDFSLQDAIPKNSGDYNTIFATSVRKIYFGNPGTIRTPAFWNTYHTNRTSTGGPFFALEEKMVKAKIKSRQAGPNTLFFDLGDMTDAMPVLWDDSQHDESTHIRGVLRVLGVTSEGRKKGMPTKKHEFFIPLSKNEEQTLVDGSAEVFPILPEALERFHQLADERTEDSIDEQPADLLPYTPHGQARGSGTAAADRPAKAYVLKAGDIVYFRPTNHGKAVAEVSLSSIWRGRVEKGTEGGKTAATLSDFIASSDPDLLPMGDSRKRNLTPAELLFGYTEHCGKGALAGRLQFAGAVPIANQGPLLHADWIDLQILNSPKPPSPNLYFRKRAGGGWIRKSELSLEKHQIQGRKIYLHTHRVEQAKSPADSRWTMHRENIRSGEFDRMRVRVRPVLADKAFSFDIRFDNLTRFEIGALLYVLAPSGTFRHKLGMGKPLGLGSVQIEPLEIEWVNRSDRYSKDLLTAPRGTRFGLSGPVDAGVPDDPRGWAADFRATLKSATPSIKALETLGDPNKIQHPVHYPQIEGPVVSEAAFETERYEWFVTNDHKNTHDAQRTHLGSVGDTIPDLVRLPKTERGGGQHQPPLHPAIQGRGPAGGTHPYPAGRQGPIKVKCLGPAEGGGWRFEGFDNGVKRFGFLDRNAQEPQGIRSGSEHLMTYTCSPRGTCFFRPA